MNSIQTPEGKPMNDEVVGADRAAISQRVLECAESANIAIRRSYVIQRPSGNDTALVYGIIEDPLERQQINDQIMNMYPVDDEAVDMLPRVEQVGFVSFSEEGNRLMMAGGEFCGNATRSAVFMALKGKPGQTTITVSGCSKPLQAGINENGDVWTEMPVLSDLNAVQDGNVPDEQVVTMEGISHIIKYLSPDSESLSRSELKQRAMELIRSYGLEELPASGVMFTKEKDGIYSIDPIVFVKSINTLIFESGCGSGSTAVALAQAKKTGASVVNMPIMQPTGMPISVSIDMSDDRIQGARIAGPVQELQRAIACEKDDENLAFNVEIVTSSNALRAALSQGMNELYRTVFAEPPYFESFTPESVQEYFEEYLEKGRVLTIRASQNKIVGFAACLPLKDVPDVYKAVQGAVDDQSAWYIAEVGISPSLRKKGLARFLTQVEMGDMQEVRTFIMRTTEENTASQSLHRSLGFRQIEGVSQQVEHERTSDVVSNVDRRIFMKYERE